MGIVQKQGIQNTVLAYLGVVLGFLNKVFLFVAFLSDVEYGLVELLITLMVVGSEVSQLGSSKIILRFFPYFYQHPQREGQFLFFILVYTLTGFAFFCGVFLLIDEWLINDYAAETVLFAERYWLLVPLIFAFSATKALEAISQSLLKSIIPTFSKQVALRLFHSVAIILYVWLDWPFDTFMLVYVWGYLVPIVLTLGYIIWLGKLRFRWDASLFRSRIFPILLVYGLFTSLTEGAVILVNRLDGIMLAEAFGEAVVAVYGYALYFATLVYIPARSLNAIAVPMVAQQLKKRDMAGVKTLYQKTAINNLIIGALVLIGIWINLDSFFSLQSRFSEGKNVIGILGLGVLFNISTGINRAIIVNSRYYRFDLLANVIMLGLVFLGNYLLIPILRVEGAALTTALGLLLFNSAGSILIWVKLRIQPFTPKTLIALGVALLTLLLGILLPKTGWPVMDIMYRSAIVSVVYLGLIVKLNISPEISNLVFGVLRRLKLMK
ncbi:MAG: MATE family efflux transporter [Bacteroidota bacterium]